MMHEFLSHAAEHGPHMTDRTRHRRAGYALIIAAAALTAACTQILESTLYEYRTDAAMDQPRNCHSTLGAYYLPRTYVHIKVSQVFVGGKLSENRIDLIDTITRPDTKRMFCLDYLASSLAHDHVKVRKTSSTATSGSQLLSTVASSSVDQTSLVVRTLIRAVFVGISGFRVAQKSEGTNQVIEPLGEFEFDPFDQVQSAIINDRLRQHGFCLVLETYTFGQPTTMADRYCRNPQKFMQTETAFGRSYVEFNSSLVAPVTPGILYRPRASYQLNVYAKDDPKSSDPWLLRRTMTIQAENISPVLSIGVDRAMFTLKQIALIFDKGALHNVCIVKKSEAVEAIKIPLEIVKGIAALPTEMLKIDYDNITKSHALAKAEYDLIAAQRQLIAIQKDANQKTASAPTAATIAAPSAFAIPAGYTDATAPALPADALAFSDSCTANAALPAKSAGGKS